MSTHTVWKAALHTLHYTAELTIALSLREGHLDETQPRYSSAETSTHMCEPRSEEPQILGRSQYPENGRMRRTNQIGNLGENRGHLGNRRTCKNSNELRDL